MEEDLSRSRRRIPQRRDGSLTATTTTRCLRAQREEARWMDTERTRSALTTPPSPHPHGRNGTRSACMLWVFRCIILLQLLVFTTTAAAIDNINHPSNLLRRQTSESTCPATCDFCCGETCYGSQEDHARCWGTGRTWTVFTTLTITATPVPKTELTTITPGYALSTAWKVSSTTVLITYYTSNGFTVSQKGANKAKRTAISNERRQLESASILPTTTLTRTATLTLPISTIRSTITAKPPDGVTINTDSPSRTFTAVTTVETTLTGTVQVDYPAGWGDSKKRDRDRKATITSIVLGAIAGVLVLTGFLWWLRNRLQKKHYKEHALKAIDEAARALSPAERMVETPWPSRNGDAGTVDEEAGVVSPFTNHKSHIYTAVTSSGPEDSPPQGIGEPSSGLQPDTATGTVPLRFPSKSTTNANTSRASSPDLVPAPALSAPSSAYQTSHFPISPAIPVQIHANSPSPRPGTDYLPALPFFPSFRIHFPRREPSELNTNEVPRGGPDMSDGDGTEYAVSPASDPASARTWIGRGMRSVRRQESSATQRTGASSTVSPLSELDQPILERKRTGGLKKGAMRIKRKPVPGH